MGAFPAPNGNVMLVRNHEINGPGAPFGDASPGVRRAGPRRHDDGRGHQFGEVVECLHQPQRHAEELLRRAHAVGLWITLRGDGQRPDVGPDFTGVSERRPDASAHGFIFEVPAGGQSNREPITAAGRFAHEAVAFDPAGRASSTSPRTTSASRPASTATSPTTNPMETGHLANGGQLQMLAVRGQPNANLAASQRNGRRIRSSGSTSPIPNPTFPYTPGDRTHDQQRRSTSSATRAGPGCGVLLASRGRASTTTASSTSRRPRAAARRRPAPTPSRGYGNGSGQVWAYRHRRPGACTCVYESPGPDVLDFPDNITTSQRGHDRAVRGQHQRQLPPRPDPATASCSTSPSTGWSAARRHAPTTSSPGATFSPDGDTLFVNIQASDGMTFAIWGPWGRSASDDNPGVVSGTPSRQPPTRWRTACLTPGGARKPGARHPVLRRVP